MIEKLSSNAYGVVRYSVGSEDEIKDLPKKGIKSGSEAELVEDDGNFRIFKFKRASKNEDGKWIEI